MGDWRVGTVADAAVPRGLVGGPFGSKLVSRDYAETGVPVIRGKNLGQGRFVDLSDAVFVSHEKFARDLRTNDAKPGDLVFTQRGTLGQVAVMPSDAPIAVVSQSQMRLRVNHEVVDPWFVYYWATSPSFLRLLDDRAIVAGVPHINLGILAAMPLPLPPLDEQRRIAAVLRALDDLIETNQRLTALLGPQARRAASQAPSIVKLSSVARMAETRQVKPSGLVEHYSLPAFDNGATPEVVDGTLIQSNKLMVREPSVLVSRLNPKWERCWLAFPGENAVASTEFVPLLGLGIQIEELWAVTSAPAYWGQMRERVTGTTGSHQRVDKSALLDLVVPDVRELPGVVRNGITELVRTASRLRDEIVDLTRTRDELLPLLMSGRVRVEDVEGVV